MNVNNVKKDLSNSICLRTILVNRLTLIYSASMKSYQYQNSDILENL